MTELVGHRFNLEERRVLNKTPRVLSALSYLALQQVDFLLEFIELLLAPTVVFLQTRETINDRLKGVIGLFLPFDSLLEILTLPSATTVQSPQVLVDLLENRSLLLLLLPPVSF